MIESIPILLDTDIGTTIDDALALAYLLRQPRCDLLGITTVSGNVAKRAAIAEAICRTEGRTDIPIHCGTSGPLLFDQGQVAVSEFEALRQRDYCKDWPSHTAIDFMRELIHSRPREITLLSIGPLTNLALLFAMDPEVQGLLKAWVSMAGAFGNALDEPEWNCGFDPLAAAMAFHDSQRHFHVGLDVTLDCQLPVAKLNEQSKGPLLGLIRDLYETDSNRQTHITLHDPLAAAAIFRPDLIVFAEGDVNVVAESGVTIFVPRHGGWDQVAMSVQPDACIDEFIKVVSEGGRR